jgi:hypothetical protein
MFEFVTIAVFSVLADFLRNKKARLHRQSGFFVIALALSAARLFS